MQEGSKKDGVEVWQAGWLLRLGMTCCFNKQIQYVDYHDQHPAETCCLQHAQNYHWVASLELGE